MAALAVGRWSTVVAAVCVLGVYGATEYYAACQASPQSITADNGVLLSPNYGTTPSGAPKKYPPNCHAATSVVATGTMQPVFEAFDLANGDTLRIVDQDPILGYSQIFTGRALPFISRRSSSIMVTFDSLGSGNTSTGFRMTWTTNFIVPPTPPASVFAGDTYTFNLSGAITQQIIRSPNYPNPYPNNANINWIVLAPPGQRLAFDLASFQTETNADMLEVFDGDDPATQSLVRSYSGNQASQMPLRILSDSSRLMIKFLTDATTQAQGFYGRCAVYTDGLTLFTIAPPRAGGGGQAAGNGGAVVTLGPAPDQVGPDTTTTVLLAFFIPLLVLAAIGGVVTYLMWYKPRKLRRMREHADMHYQITDRPRSAAGGRPGTARPETARPGTARPGTARPGTAAGRGQDRPGTARPTAARPTTARPAAANPERIRPGTAATRPAGADPASASTTQPSAVRLELPAAAAGAGARPATATSRQQAAGGGARAGEMPRTVIAGSVTVTRTEYSASGDTGLSPPGAVSQLVAPTLSSRTTRKLADGRDKFVGETIDDNLSVADVRRAAASGPQSADDANPEGLAGTLRDLLDDDDGGGAGGESARARKKSKKKKAQQQQQQQQAVLPPLAGGMPKLSLPPIRAPAERSVLLPLDELPAEREAGRAAPKTSGRGGDEAAAVLPESLPPLKAPKGSYESTAATNRAFAKSASDPTEGENDSDHDW